jgi:hypothetical protein
LNWVVALDSTILRAHEHAAAAMKISEIILLLERDGWKLKRVSGS